MSTQKTKVIEINKDFFNGGSSSNKTRKNRIEKKARPIPQIITPNNLKNKLLERIKAHKKKENTLEPQKIDETTYHNELGDSMNYLSSLLKEKKKSPVPLPPVNSTHNKTVKNYYSNTNNISFPHVELELPEELKDFSFDSSDSSIKLNNKANQNQWQNQWQNQGQNQGQNQAQNQGQNQSQHQAQNQKYFIDKDVPYGCLKGGVKPTYKTWNTTQKNNIITNPQEALIIDNNLIVKERENKLAKLREKMRKKQEEIKKQTSLCLLYLYSKSPV